ncbi:hypothetical protein EMIT0232MI5_170013 [Pseudomonas sp. IT-232MI5]
MCGNYVSRRNGVDVGAAEGCDLLMLALKSKVKRSQPRFTRQLLHSFYIAIFRQKKTVHRPSAP